MTSSASPLVADALVDCIATGRDPTIHDLFALAQRMWVEGAPNRSAFAWDRLASDGSDRLIAMRWAHAALSGTDRLSVVPRL